MSGEEGAMLANVAEFRKMREELLRERDKLLSQVAEIEEALGLVDTSSSQVERQRGTGVRKGITSRVETYIMDNPGSTSGEIGQALGLPTSKLSLTHLLQSGRIRREGEAGQYRYFVVTSEREP